LNSEQPPKFSVTHQNVRPKIISQDDLVNGHGKRNETHLGYFRARTRKSPQQRHDDGIVGFWKKAIKDRNGTLIGTVVKGWTETLIGITCSKSLKFRAASFFISAVFAEKWRMVLRPKVGTSRNLWQEWARINKSLFKPLPSI
jgi:hypothetical protein